MMNMGLFMLADPTVSANTTDASNIRFNGECFAGVSFKPSRTEFERVASTGGWTGTNRGVWLDTGVPAAAWIERTINSGTLDDDAGSGRLNLSVERRFGMSQASAGVRTTNITFKFYDAASGGSELDSVTYDIKAEFTV